jgi:hypothetical protein
MGNVINAELNRDSAYKCNYVKNRAVFTEAVLLIVASLQNGTGFGSGFFITPDGYAATNEHVVRGAVSISVKRSDGTFCAARVVAVDKEHDLAVLKVNAATCRFCEVEASGELPAPETPVAVFGYPLGSKLSDTVSGMNISVTRGYVASTQTLRGKKTLVLDAELFHGSSGSAVVNAETGRVIGVHRAAFQDSAGSAAELTIPVQYLCALFGRTAKNTTAKNTETGSRARTPASNETGKKTPPRRSEASAVEKCLFATCMRHGFGCERSPETARQLDMDAAKAGSAVSLYSLSGDVFLKNLPEETIRLLSDFAQKGYDAGHIFAAHNYAGCFRFGLGRQKDEAKGVKMMLALCEPTPFSEKQQKITEEYVALAHAAHAIPEAETYFREELNRYLDAMKNGNAFSLLNVGLCYIEGKSGFPRDARQGFGYILRAAQQDHFYACLHAGFCYEHGIGVEKSEKNAATWYRKGTWIAKDSGMKADMEAKKREISRFYRSYIQ